MPDWEITEDGINTTVPSREALQEELRAEQENNLLLTESIADLEMALDERGWSRGTNTTEEFTLEGRRLLISLCRTYAIANPLIKRGLLIRIGYIWGQGVEVQARAGENDTQDVNAVVQRFWEDNTAVLTGSQAQEENERALGTDGEVFVGGYTSPLTGRVQCRTFPAAEITDTITNPEDRDEPWFYVRTYVQRNLEPGLFAGSTIVPVRGKVVTVVHPALGYRPSQRIKNLNGAQVRWDAPILHIPVNRLDGWLRGMPDVYAAIAWARAYKDFLTDGAQVTHSLAQFVWKATGGTKSRAQKVATEMTSKLPLSADLPKPNGAAGAAAVMDAGNNLEALNKSGAGFTFENGKPLAGMAAAGLGVPVTMLLADPGITGARATAETLDLPTILEMSMRRMLWEQKLTELLEYVIDQAVLAPRGGLRGTAIIDDWGQKVVTLTGDVEKTIEWEWPPLVDIDPVAFLTALVAVEGTDLVPKPDMLRKLLLVMGFKDVDEILKKVTDDQGNWIDQVASAGDQAVKKFRNGQDPTQGL